MQFPIHIALHRSRLLVVLLLLLHALAASSVIGLPWAWPVRCSLLFLLGLSLWNSLRAPKILGLRLSADGRLVCRLADGEPAEALLLPDSAAFSRLIVLRLRTGDARSVTSLALFPDSMPADQFRVLRLWLRWRDESARPHDAG